MPAPPVLRRTRTTAQQRAMLDLLHRSDRFRGAQQLHLISINATASESGC